MMHISFSIYDTFDGGTFNLFLAASYLLTMVIVKKVLSHANFRVTRKLTFMLTGCIHGVLTINFPEYLQRPQFTPNMAELLLLPIAILRAVYSMDMYYMKKYLSKIMTTTLIGIFTFTVINLFMLLNLAHYKYGWMFVLIFIFSMSGIDKVENVRRYKQFEGMRDGIVMLEGEFVFGLCLCFSALAVFDLVIGDSVTSWVVVIKIIAVKFVGVLLLGFAVGAGLSYLLLRDYGNVCNTVFGVLFGIYFTYFVSIYYLEISGVIPTIIISILLCQKRERIPAEADESLERHWEIVYYFIEYTAYILLITESVCFIHANLAGLSYFKHVSVFFMGELSRMLFLCVLYPIMARTGSLKMNDFLVLFWFAKRGLPQLILVGLILNHYPEEKAGWLSVVLVHIVVHHLNVGLLTSVILKFFRLSKLSPAKDTNFLNCLRLVESKKRIFLNRLKMNRYFGDCNWNLIEKYTELVNIDALNSQVLMSASSSLWRERKSMCKECNKEILLMPSRKEHYQMALEAKLIALSAQKMSVIHQYEKCMITKDVLRRILQNLENNEGNPDLHLDINDIFFLFKERTLLDHIRDIFLDLHQKEDSSPPRNQSRRIVYMMVTHEFYEIFIFLVVITSFVDYYVSVGNDLIELYLGPVFYCVFFLMDFLLKIYGYSHIFIKSGIKKYFSYYWNKLEFILLISNVMIIVFNYYWVPNNEEYMVHIVQLVIWQIPLLRIMKIVVVIYNLRLRIIWLCDKRIGRRMSFAYSLGLCLVVCYKEILHLLPILVSKNDVCQMVMQDVKMKIEEITVELFRIQNLMPYIAVTVKTKQISLIALCNMKNCVNELKTTGLTDAYEHAYLIQAINVNAKAVTTLGNLGVNPPQMVFFGQIWFEGIDDTKKIFESSFLVNWQPGEVIFEKGVPSLGLYIIIEGLLVQHYSPEEKILNHVRKYGMLPVMDYLSSANYLDSTTKYILPGNSIGFLSLITGRPYEAAIISQSMSRAYFIPKAIIQDYLAEDIAKTVQGLYNNIWKFISIEIAMCLIRESTMYNIHSEDGLYFKMRKAHVPNLRNCEFFVKNETVDDIILIEGIVEEVYQNLKFVAPCCLPRTINKLKLIDTWVTPVLMVISMKDQELSAFKSKTLTVHPSSISSRTLSGLK